MLRGHGCGFALDVGIQQALGEEQRDHPVIGLDDLLPQERFLIQRFYPEQPPAIDDARRLLMHIGLRALRVFAGDARLRARPERNVPLPLSGSLTASSFARKLLQ